MPEQQQIPEPNAHPPLIKNYIARHGFQPAPSPVHAPVVAYYLRKSSADPLDFSVGAQFAVCSFDFRSLVEVQPQPLVFIDRHRSGATMAGREALAELLKAADERRFQTLIIRSVCRLTRSVTDAAYLYERLTACGVSIRVAGQGEIQEFEAVLLGLSAQRERERILASSRDGLVSAAKEGRYFGKRPSPGYIQIDGNTDWRIDETKAAPLRRAFHDLDRGMTVRAVCVQMHKDGVPPPTGDLWEPQKFFKTEGSGWLQKPILKGELTYKFENHPPIVFKRPDLAIVEADVFDRVNDRFGSRSSTAKTLSEHPFLRGLVRCACGSRMEVMEQHSSYYVQCRTAPLGGPCNRTDTFGIGELVRRVLLLFRYEILDLQRGPEWEGVRHEAWRELDAALSNERSRISMRLEQIASTLDRLDPDDGQGPAPLAMAECSELELEHHRLSEGLARLETPPFRTLDWGRIDVLQAKVLGVLQRLPLTGRSAEDLEVIGLVRGLVESIELDIGDEDIGLQLRLGIPGSPEGFGGSTPLLVPWKDRFGKAPRTPMRYPEVVLGHHARAEAGAFALDDEDWRAVQPVMLEAGDHHLRYGGRMAAEALVFMQSTGLAPAYLPERYGAFADAITKRGHASTWLRIYEILKRRRSPVLNDLGPATPVPGKTRRLRSCAYPVPPLPDPRPWSLPTG